MYALRRSPGCVGRRLMHSRPPPLVHAHKDFLDMVKGHGDGDITLVDRENYVELILCNPAKRNSITGKMMYRFAEIVDELVVPEPDGVDRSKVVAVVLTGAGKEAFCSGADLVLAKEVLDTPSKGGMMSNFMTDALNRLRQSNLISVCCLNGPALGGGSEITTAFDFRVMPNDESSYIQFIHAKIGASPGWGGARRLTNIVGRSHALMACAGSLKIPAEAALSMRLVDAIYPPYDATTMKDTTPEAYAISQGVKLLQPFLVQKFPGSVRAIKQAVAGVEDLSTAESKSVEAELFRQRWAGSDNKSALKSTKPAK